MKEMAQKAESESQLLSQSGGSVAAKADAKAEKKKKQEEDAMQKVLSLLFCQLTCSGRDLWFWIANLACLATGIYTFIFALALCD